MSREGPMVETIVFEFQNAYVPIRGSAGEEASIFVGRPRDEIDRCFVQREVKDPLPLVVLFPPNEYLSIVAGGSKDVPVFRMCPRDTPHSAFVSITD